MTFTFTLADSIKMLEPVTGSNWKPVGCYWTYQKSYFETKWWSYNLFKLKQIQAKNGGYIMDSFGKLI